MVHSPKELFGNINFIFKLVEWIILLVTCIIMADKNTSFYDWRSRDLTIVAAGGYFIITFSLFLIYIFDNTNILYELITLLPGAILLLVAAILCIIHYADDSNNRGNTLLVAVLGLAAGVIMLIDWIFLIKKK